MEVVRGRKPHVLAVSIPALGHVNSLMKLLRHIAKHGIKVTFVNVQSIHEKLAAAAAAEDDDEVEDNLTLTSIPDVIRSDDNPLKFFEMARIMIPGYLTDLIHRINSSTPDQKINCIIVDITIKWISEIAQNMGVQFIAFSSSSAAIMAMSYQITKLLDEGTLDSNGNAKKGEIISLSDNIPVWRNDELPWSFPTSLENQKIIFGEAQESHKKINLAEWVLGNTSYELESAACDLIPNFLSIGPLLHTRSPNSSIFYPEDASCLSWLDDQQAGSVIYVSFGSIAVFSQHQFDELALGLELSGRAFLWVVRSDLANGSSPVYPDGFLDRVNKLGKIVEWAPQEKVLSHPSIACFLSHCGWNSTLEGLCNGVPFLCWPSFLDQFHNQNYICDEWKIGLRISADENGIRPRHEIKNKIDVLFTDAYFKENALKLKEMCKKSINEGGSSYKNLLTFIDRLWK